MSDSTFILRQCTLVILVILVLFLTPNLQVFHLFVKPNENHWRPDSNLGSWPLPEGFRVWKICSSWYKETQGNTRKQKETEGNRRKNNKALGSNITHCDLKLILGPVRQGTTKFAPRIKFMTPRSERYMSLRLSSSLSLSLYCSNSFLYLFFLFVFFSFLF